MGYLGQAILVIADTCDGIFGQLAHCEQGIAYYRIDCWDAYLVERWGLLSHLPCIA